MKKGLAFLFLFLSMAIFAGCGKETNKVEQKVDSDVGKVEMEMQIPKAEGGVESTEDIEFFDEQNTEDGIADITQADMSQSESEQNILQNENVISEESSVAKDETTVSEETSKAEPQKVEESVKQEIQKTENDPKLEVQENKEESEKIENSMDYEEFQKLSPLGQQKYMETFANIESFFVWYNKAKSEYEKEHPPIIIEGDSLDAGDYLGGE